MRSILRIMFLIPFFLCGCQTYYVSRVDSGVVPANLTLKQRYRIASAEISRSAEYPMRYEENLSYYVLDPDAKIPVPQFYKLLPKLYPGVFSDDENAVPVHIEMCVTKLIPNLLTPICEIRVFSPKKKAIIGEEGIVMTAESVYDPNDPQHHYQGWRMARGIFDPDPCRTFMIPLELGMAGAIAAALEKGENNGRRLAPGGKPPVYRKIFQAPLPPPEEETLPQTAATAQNGSSVQYSQDNSAAALNFFMGSMGGIRGLSGISVMHRVPRRLHYQSRRVSGFQTLRAQKRNFSAAETTSSTVSRTKQVQPKQIQKYVKVPRASSFSLSDGTSSDSASRPYTGLQQAK